ncbi:hypothetical protein ACVOMT_22525 [Sphingomonas panni]
MEGIDLDAAKRRAEAMRPDLEAFVAQVQTRGDAFREEAIAVRDKANTNAVALAKADLPKGYDGAVDFDEIIKGQAPTPPMHAAKRRSLSSSPASPCRPRRFAG